MEIDSVEQVLAYWESTYLEYRGSVRVFSEIEDLLTALSNRQCRLGIITSKNKLEYEQDFMPFGLASKFTHVVCADETTLHKPHPEPMLAYLKKSGANRQDVLYIGDSRYDMACARDAGVSCALALWGCKTPDGIRADYYLKHPREVLSLIL